MFPEKKCIESVVAHHQDKLIDKQITNLSLRQRWYKDTESESWGLKVFQEVNIFFFF